MAGCQDYRYNIPRGVKIAAFAVSVISLSWFFAGWRQLHEAPTLANWLLLAGGVASTILLLGLQGYWIYFDEKSKGRLRKRIELYEKIHARLFAKTQAAACVGDGGDRNARQ